MRSDPLESVDYSSVESNLHNPWGENSPVGRAHAEDTTLSSKPYNDEERNLFSKVWES